MNARKLAPTLFHLFLDGWLPEAFAIVSTGRMALSDKEFRARVVAGANEFSHSGKAAIADWNNFSEHIGYQVSDVKHAATYKEFGKRIEPYEKGWKASVKTQ